MVKNEPMLVLASFFWSDAINAFLFGHGPMTPTLLDVMMLIGLSIIAPDRSFDFLDKTSFKIETRTIGGWKEYITKNMRTGSVSLREHTAFLNMWLEKFIFCGKTADPTNNTLKMAETLAGGNLVPLGKHLLGSVYYLLHQVSAKLRDDQPISNLRGPWWFIQLWLNMYMRKGMVIKLSELSFPSEEYDEGEDSVARRCTSFGEAAIMIANDSNVFGKTDFFRCFYNGFTEYSTI